jgi:hypothetical protein
MTLTQSGGDIERVLWRVQQDGSSSGLRYGGRFMRSPFAGSLYPAELMTLSRMTPKEYVASIVFEHMPAAPVLVSCSQHYALLAELVRDARRALPRISLAIVRVGAPNFAVPVPPDLLANDVLLAHDPTAMAVRVRAAGRANVLTIEDTLRRDGYEVGGNEISLTIYGADDLPAFVAFVRASRSLRGLADATFAPVGDDGRAAQASADMPEERVS